MHDAVALKGLLTPVQQENRVTFKAMDGGRLVGFASWTLPNVDAPKRREGPVGEVKKGGLPEIPGVNTALWTEMVDGLKDYSVRDVEPSEDLCNACSV